MDIDWTWVDVEVKKTVLIEIRESHVDNCSTRVNYRRDHDLLRTEYSQVLCEQW